MMTSPQTRDTIIKWYKRIGFPEKYDAEFYKALDEIEIPDDTSIDTYDETSADGKKNFLSLLYMCEVLSERYAEKGIPDGILDATVKDIRIWTDIWSEIKGELFLGQVFWLKYHLTMKLFRIGRLQFCHTMADKEYPEHGIKKSDGTLDVHIPADGRLDPDECRHSFSAAIEFYEKYFPEVQYTYFNCHSWLLDDTLKKYLPPESNIIKFGDMFERISSEEAYDLFRYIFRWNIKNRELLADFEPTSRFGATIKDAAMKGEKFYNTLGIIRRDSVKVRML